MEVIYVFVIAFFIWLIVKSKSDAGKVKVDTKFNKKEVGLRKENDAVVKSPLSDRKSDEQNKVDAEPCGENDKKNAQITSNYISRASSEKKVNIDSTESNDRAQRVQENERDIGDTAI